MKQKFKALPCSLSASESGAKRPAEGSESSPRPSPAPSLLPLHLGERGKGNQVDGVGSGG